MKKEKVKHGIPDFMKEARRIGRGVIAWRRDFHREPERGFEEKETSKKIQAILNKAGIPFEIRAGTGVVGFIKGRKKSPVLGLRADMDALPVKEETGLPYASKRDGFMHACGHDGHMAVLLGAGTILSRFRDSLPGNVELIFQPAEERPPGGAGRMIKEGVTGKIDFMLGFHFMPEIPLRNVAIGAGPVMANTDSFAIRIKGEGGHGSQPHRTKDPVTCAAYLITQIQAIVSRKVPPLEPVVISIGSIHGGDAFNVIPDSVEIKGTVRTMDDKTRDMIRKEMRRTADSVCSVFGCSAGFVYDNYCPSVINDARLAENIGRITRGILSPGALADRFSSMGGEDFAFFSRTVPSCYIFIGVGAGCGVLHSGKYRLNEDILPFSVNYLASLAYALLIPE